MKSTESKKAWQRLAAQVELSFASAHASAKGSQRDQSDGHGSLYSENIFFSEAGPTRKFFKVQAPSLLGGSPSEFRGRFF